VNLGFTGSSYDENGVYGAWYTNATRNSYVPVEQCYAGVFSNKTMGPYRIVGQAAPQSVILLHEFPFIHILLAS